MVTPATLYKYESFSAQSIENLKNQVIYFGSPSRFNDPYDCALFPNIREPSDTEVEQIRLSFLAKDDLAGEVRAQFANTSVTELRVILLRIGQDVVNREIQQFVSQRGVSCFSERSDNLLMWSHYAGHHKGFCLEFKTDSETFARIRKVKYCEHMPAIELAPMLCDENFDQVLDLFCTKSLDWKYEQEWRAIHKEAGTAYTYPADALTGVYFGPEASFTSFEIVALILAGQNEHVKLWKGRRSKSNFSVDFEHVTYMSHIEAKRRGLL